MNLSLTLILIGVTVLVSWQAFEKPRLLDRLLLWPPAIDRHRQYDRLVTHGFVHADWQHLLFNMITLYFFGRLVEGWFVPYIGHVGFVLFYLSAIVVAILPTYLRHRHDARGRRVPSLVDVATTAPELTGLRDAVLAAVRPWVSAGVNPSSEVHPSP